MKIKLDENLPSELVDVLSALGHDVDTVVEEDLSGRQDDAVWLAAQDAGRLLVTQDLDFSDIRKFLPGTHCGIILVRLRDPSRSALVERVRVLFEDQPSDGWSRCFVVATEHKLRVRRPS